MIELYAFDVAFVSIMKLCGIFFNSCTFKDENIYKFLWLSQFKMSYSGLMGHMLLLTFPSVIVVGHMYCNWIKPKNPLKLPYVSELNMLRILLCHVFSTYV